MIPAERLAQFLENGTIEIAPLAFMRGRTLDRAFVILDEAQNTTPSQMKMFLTRMGPPRSSSSRATPLKLTCPASRPAAFRMH